MAEIILLSGTRGTGKTNMCAALAQRARERGWAVAGLLSPGAFLDGQKVEIDVQDLRTLERRRLARLRRSWMEAAADGVHTQSWDFSDEGLAWGEDLLRHVGPCDLLIIDELGMLEFQQGSGWQAAFEAIAAGQYQIAVVAVRNELLADARQRWPEAQVWPTEDFSPEKAEEFTEVILARLGNSRVSG